MSLGTNQGARGGLLGLAMGLGAMLAGDVRAGIVDVRVLSSHWIDVVFDQYDPVQARIQSDKDFEDLLQKYKQNKVSRWKVEEAATSAAMLAIEELRPAFLAKIEDPKSYQVAAGAQALPVLRVSHWSVPVDTLRWRATTPYPLPNGYKNSKMVRLADHVYVELDAPLAEGAAVTVTVPGEAPFAFAFDSKETVDWSIKVNQVAYVLRDGAKRYAYLGNWLAAFGPLDVTELASKPFHVHAYQAGADRWHGKAIGEPVLTGVITPRSKASFDKVPRDNIPVTGEDVYEMDLGGLVQAGEYVIVIPGHGRSWPFRVEVAAAGEPFYHVARALMHQRAGVPVPEANSAWHRPASHKQVILGGFLPRGEWYIGTRYAGVRDGQRSIFGFRDAATQVAIEVDPFDMVKATATATIMPKVTGGWWDAADYDRRPEHLDGTFSLAGAFELWPDHFSDGQLNIPESGNGIPDILDLALDPVELMRSSQRPGGALSAWIESTAHPSHDQVPWEDPLNYYASLPMRSSNALYAAAAALLARLVRPYDATRGQLLQDSAVAAYLWAANPENRISGLKFSMPDKKVGVRDVIFDERPESGQEELMLARIQLWLTTGNEEFKKAFYGSVVRHGARGERAMGAVVRTVAGRPDENPFRVSSILKHRDKFSPVEIHALMQSMLGITRPLITGMEQSPYRHFWRTREHPHFSHLAWGEAHPVKRARVAAVLWYATGQDVFRSACERALDFELGANPMGRAMTTGLGTVFPVMIQHISSELDAHAEPVPGLSPFTFTYGVDPSARTHQFGLIEKDRKRNQPVALAFLANEFSSMLRARLSVLGADSRAQGKFLASLVDKHYPVLRRTFPHYRLSPRQNEFTVHESIASHAAVYGALLPPGWRPGPRELDRKPIDEKLLPWYYQP